LKRLFLYLTNMKKTILQLFVTVTLFALMMGGCKSKQPTASKSNETQEAIAISEEEEQAFQQVEGDTISIADNKTEYEILIIEPGFNIWLRTIARPEGFYSQRFLENRNQIWVTNWNNRVNQPQLYSSRLYEMPIDYQPHIDYGYEVNYKLYNYFIYFQRKYRQRLGTFTPRI